MLKAVILSYRSLIGLWLCKKTMIFFKDEFFSKNLFFATLLKITSFVLCKVRVCLASPTENCQHF